MMLIKTVRAYLHTGHVVATAHRPFVRDTRGSSRKTPRLRTRAFFPLCPFSNTNISL